MDVGEGLELSDQGLNLGARRLGQLNLSISVTTDVYLRRAARADHCNQFVLIEGHSGLNGYHGRDTTGGHSGHSVGSVVRVRSLVHDLRIPAIGLDGRAENRLAHHGVIDELEEAVRILGLEQVTVIKLVTAVEDANDPLTRDVRRPHVRTATDEDEVVLAEADTQLFLVESDVAPFVKPVVERDHEAVQTQMQALAFDSIPRVANKTEHIPISFIHRHKRDGLNGST